MGTSALPVRAEYGHGVSWRMIVDLGEPDALRVILPPGNGGDALSSGGDRMLARWARGEYATLRLAMPEGA